MISRVVLAALTSVAMVTGAVAWDGARAYHLEPVGSSSISLTANYLHQAGTVNLGGPIVGTDLTVGVLTPTYRTSFDFGGNIGHFLIGMPVGGTTYTSDGGAIDEDTGLTYGDLFVGGVWGLVGSPSLSPMEYAQHAPGFRASLSARLFLPTGAYDENELINLGTNRWSLEASLPFSYTLGTTMIDPDLTTFEIRPMVQIFSDNEDAFGLASVMSQDPVWGVEGHVTRNFGNSFWASLDGYADAGGEIYMDGTATGVGREAVALGATLGVVFSPQLAARLSWREQVWSSLEDSSARNIELSTAFLF